MVRELQGIAGVDWIIGRDVGLCDSGEDNVELSCYELVFEELSAGGSRWDSPQSHLSVGYTTLTLFRAWVYLSRFLTPSSQCSAAGRSNPHGDSADDARCKIPGTHC